MDRAEIFEIIVISIASLSKLSDTQWISEATDLIDDLCYDSMDLQDLGDCLESKFGVERLDSSLWIMVGDIVTAVHKLKG